MRRRILSLSLLVATAAGCAREEPPTGTGAREAAAGFFEAVVRRDWPTAYAGLHPESRRGLDTAAFIRKAKTYRAALGFEPAKVVVRSCVEQGEQATAHLLLTDALDSRRHSFRESIALKRAPDGWGVVLHRGFGRSVKVQPR